MMQDQLERSKGETEGILKMKAQVEAVLEGLGKNGLVEKEEGAEAPRTETVQEEVDVAEDVWEELQREFG
jgi:mediator of RNA polymerase II transcription subunit 7